MGEATPVRAVGYELSSVGYAVSRGFKKALADYDLDPREFGLLRDVEMKEGQSQQGLAHALQIPPSRIVAIVDGLERRGLIERRAHASDRRVRELYLTDEGRSVIRAAYEDARAYEDRLTTHLTDKEREQLLELLDRVAAALGIDSSATHTALVDPEDSAA
jgi:DNA-binding MarR family transcriptional regulator